MNITIWLCLKSRNRQPKSYKNIVCWTLQTPKNPIWFPLGFKHHLQELSWFGFACMFSCQMCLRLIQYSNFHSKKFDFWELGKLKSIQCLQKRYSYTNLAFEVTMMNYFLHWYFDKLLYTVFLNFSLISFAAYQTIC